jgi:hypothetical protein
MKPYVEKDCVFTHEGKAFESGGAIVTDDVIIAYPDKDSVLRDWHGKPLGTWRTRSRWRVRSHMGTYMHQIEAIVSGRTYTGRGFGEGMIFRGRRVARERRRPPTPIKPAPVNPETQRTQSLPAVTMAETMAGDDA